MLLDVPSISNPVPVRAVPERSRVSIVVFETLYNCSAVEPALVRPVSATLVPLTLPSEIVRPLMLTIDTALRQLPPPKRLPLTSTPPVNWLAVRLARDRAAL